MTKLEQLQRQVDVLRAHAAWCAGLASVPDIAARAALALYESDQITSKPVTETDRETVDRWVNAADADLSRVLGAYWDGVWLTWYEPTGDAGSPVFVKRSVEFHGGLAAAYSAAAAWIRKQEAANG